MFAPIENFAKKRAAKFMVANFPPSHFGDPLSLKTEWIYCSPGGPEFKSSQLHRVSPWHWEFRRTGGVVVRARLFTGLGLAILVGAWCCRQFVITDIDQSVFNKVILTGGLLLVAGLALFHSAAVRMIFDKENGYHYKSRQRKSGGSYPSRNKQHVDLNRIHAIQLLGRRPELKSITFILYEMNLVLEDASRLNVVAHGDLGAMREDALALSEFLGKPLWDSIGGGSDPALRRSS